ncbi:MAG: amino acid racemase [Spirochaetia bacterium]|jgi:aspartate racemase|nr:amino acid racemase [Spirochaetales bacterium]
MKKIGIVGGLGPESTVEYYRGIIEAFKPTYEQLGYPEIGIESVDLHSMVADAQEGAWDKIASMISNRFEILRRGGAELGAIASNTPHKVFDQVQQDTALPLLNIVDAARDHAVQLGVKTLCLLGTKFTMESDFYQKAFHEAGLHVVVPKLEEIDYVQEKLFSEIEFGVIKDSTKDRFISIIDRITADQNIEGVILGCTELPLLLKPEDISLHYIDTTAIHIAKIVERCREE